MRVEGIDGTEKSKKMSHHYCSMNYERKAKDNTARLVLSNEYAK